MKDKQIEEMAKEVIGGCDECSKCPLSFDCKAYEYATKFYIAGYRKASDVARVIFEEIEKLTASVYNDFMYNRVDVGMNVVQFSDELDNAIAELKKKYESEGE